MIAYLPLQGGGGGEGGVGSTLSFIPFFLPSCHLFFRFTRQMVEFSKLSISVNPAWGSTEARVVLGVTKKTVDVCVGSVAQDGCQLTQESYYMIESWCRKESPCLGF